MTVKGFIFIAFLLASTGALGQQNNLSADYSRYLPEVRAYYKKSPGFPKMTITPEVIKLIREYMNKPQKTVLKPTQQEIDGPYGKIGLRILRPENVDAVFLNIHGGGNLWGSAMAEDSLSDVMARTCRMAVVGVDYHLAPEYPFPAQIADCKVAAKWLLANAKTIFGTDKVFIGGGSAGAQLAASTMLYVRDSLRAASKVIGVGLHNGIFDLGKTPSFRNATDSTPGLNKSVLDEIMKVVYSKFSTDQLQRADFSPLYADLKNLPPAFFLCGTADGFIDDTSFMEARWRLAGNKTYLALFPEAAHGFYAAPLTISEIANTLFFDWLKKRIKDS